MEYEIMDQIHMVQNGKSSFKMANKFCLPYSRKFFELLPTKFSQEGHCCVELTTKTTLITILLLLLLLYFIQFNGYLLTDRLNSKSAYDKASTKTEIQRKYNLNTQKQHIKHTQQKQQ